MRSPFRLPLILAAALLCCTAGPTLATPLSTLVEERAMAEWGDALPDSGTFDISLQSGAPDNPLSIPDFWMDRATGQFAANVLTSRGELVRVYGMATLSVPVPVPLRRFMPGDVIGDSDLTVVSMPAGQIGPFAVTDSADLSGKQVRRVLVPGRPVMQQSVIEPTVVERGDRVTLAYAEGALNLTAPGKALSSGAEGEGVRAINLASNKTVTGIARADGLVEVSK